MAVVRVDNLIPRIIDDETFYRIQERMNLSKQQPKARSDIVYILSGIAKCGECGQALTGSSHNQKNKKYEYYRCNNAHRTFGQACSNKKRYNKEAIEQEVIIQAKIILNKLKLNIDEAINDIYEETLIRQNSENAEKQEVFSKLQGIQKEMDNLVASIAAGVDAKFIAPKLNDLGNIKDSLERRLRIISRNEVSKEMVVEHVNKVVFRALDPANPVECREDLRALFGEIIILNDSITLPAISLA